MLALPIIFVLLSTNHGHNPEVSVGGTYPTLESCQGALREAEAMDRGHNL
jgi:hypothetical protein